jgi:hypothetical protein
MMVTDMRMLAGFTGISPIRFVNTNLPRFDLSALDLENQKLGHPTKVGGHLTPGLTGHGNLHDATPAAMRLHPCL